MTPLDALYRAQRAWEASQPQLFFELWPDDGLDETHVPARPYGVPGAEAAVRLVEPVVTPRSLPGYGLTAGAEPCRDLLGTDGASSLITALAAPMSAGSAPLSNTTGPHALPPKRTRAAQRRSF